MNPNILATTTYQAGKAENKPALIYGSSNLAYLYCSSKPTSPIRNPSKQKRQQSCNQQKLK